MEKTKPYMLELIGRAVVGLILLFTLLGLPSVTYSATIALQWNPPTTNSNGSTLVDLAHYRLYYGYKSRNYNFPPIYTNKPIANVTVSDGSNYYFAVTAVNSNNVESDYSNEYFWNRVPSAQAILTSADSVTVPEGGTATFQVKLSTAPVSPTTVTVSWVSGDTHVAVQSGGSRVFNASTWNTYQTVTLSAAEDADTVNYAAVIRCSASGLASKDVTATEQDNDGVVAIGGGTIGSTGEGTFTDVIWDNGAWINACRFTGRIRHAGDRHVRQGHSHRRPL